MKIGHISDIHWLDTQGAKFTDFLNKRISGGINLLAGRARIHSTITAQAAIEKIKDLGCTHLIVSGDLTNLALPAEFNSVRIALNRYFIDEKMTIVPGNHDFYTRESEQAKRFETCMYRTPPGNLDFGGDETWPFVQIVKDVAFIGVNSAQPRPWFVAAGRIGSHQLDLLEKALAHPEVASRTKIVVLHHHLFQVLQSPGESLRKLEDASDFIDVCLDGKVNMIVHGHNHDYSIKRLKNIIIAEAGSCSVCNFKSPNRAGKFNVYTISEQRIRIDTWLYDNNKFNLWKSLKPDDIEPIERSRIL